MIKYYKLFDLLNRREMKKTDLLQVISKENMYPNLAKAASSKTDVIQKICDFLNCQPGDIMENVLMRLNLTKTETYEYSKELRDENTEKT